MTPKKKKNNLKENLLLLKWLLLISACLILGGLLSFGLILLTANLIDNSQHLSPIWIVGMIPLMAIVSFPVTYLVYRQVAKNLTVLVTSMAQVADGNLDTYIPTAEAKDFKAVFENFNKMVAEIQNADIMRTSMFDNLSHELKTPIASIGGFAKLLKEKSLTEEKKQKYLEIIASESERLDKLVKSVLLLGKLSAQEIVSHKESYSLTRQLQECVISLENDWANKNINMSADLSEVMYGGDEQLMKSLWINLLSNAVKFTPSGGEICINMTADEQNITVQITDTGIGMTQDVVKHIFERHFQADSSYSGGQGLGLAIAKRIVKLCGGNISVQSKVAEGSTFTVTLPK